MENNLADLADIQLPPEPGFWPLAPGWWILLALVLILIILFYVAYRRKKRQAYRQKALNEFKQLQKQFADSNKINEFLQATSLLLRRTALTAQPKNFDPALKGQAWLNWLDHYCPKLTGKFGRDLGQALIVGQYQKSPDINIDEFVNLVEDWINKHQNQWQNSQAFSEKEMTGGQDV